MSGTSSLRRGRVAVLVLMLAGAAGCAEAPSGSWSEQAGVWVFHDPSTDRTHYLVIDAFPTLPPRSVVFFEWDSAGLSDRARRNLEEFARAFAELPNARVELTGHADASGGSAHNQRLSERRIGAVVAELVRLGVSADSIRPSAFGETRPLVPTRDGVQEQQNRRVDLRAVAEPRGHANQP